jgi:glyoxylase-like metal-dependent hydrolase (beta-lactamase superfamily II)
MRSIGGGVFIETKYAGVQVGAISTEKGLVLVDCPLRVEDARQWIAQLAEHGQPVYMALLDHHPERVLGARGLEIHRIAQDETRRVMSEWPDTFKGSAHPLGAESDNLKRISGVSRAVPELSFSEEMIVLLGGREIHFLHRAGPMPGAMWVALPDAQIVFIGDTVAMSEPPYIGEAVVDAWLSDLNALRDSPYSDYKILSSRDGMVTREAINLMARFVRKIPGRVKKIAARKGSPAAVSHFAAQLLGDFKLPATRQNEGAERLALGLKDLYMARYCPDE